MILHCSKCHHEWEGEEGENCDWCGADSYPLDEDYDTRIINRMADHMRSHYGIDIGTTSGE